MPPPFAVILAALALLLIPSSAFPAAQPSAGKTTPLEKRTNTFIKTTPATKTWNDQRPRHLAWAGRVLASPFKKRAEGAAWGPAATRFVKRALPEWVEMFNGYRGLADVDDEAMSWIEETRQLEKDGCDDVLVLYLGACAASARDEFELARGWFRKIMPMLEDKTLSRALARLVALDFSHLNDNHGRTSPDLDAKALAWTGEVLSDGSYLPEEASIMVEHMLDGRADKHAERQADALAELFQKSKIAPWAQHTLVGACEVNRAWNARGSDVAANVKRDGWRGFGEHLGRARKELTAAYKLAPTEPYAATELISVAMGDGAAPGETPAVWFQRATAARVDFRAAYERLMTALLPRWGGTHAAMLALAQDALAEDRRDTELPSVVPWICLTISDDLDNWRPFYRDPVVARLLVTASQQLLESPAQASRKTFRISSLAVNAWLAGDFPLAAQTLAPLGGKLHRNSAWKAWRYYGDETAPFLSEVKILASPGRADFEAVEKAFADGRREAARAGYERVQKAFGDEAAVLIRRRLAALDFEEQFARGEWVQAAVTEDLAAWQVGRGDWSATPDGGLLCRGDGGSASLAFRGRVGGTCEVRAEVSFEGAADRDAGFAIGVGVHDARKSTNFASGHIYRSKTAPEVILAGAGSHYMAIREFHEEKRPVAPTYQLHVSWREDKLHYELDGKVIAESFSLPEPPEAGYGQRFALGAMDLDEGVTLRVRKVEVRRLAEAIRKK